MKFIWFAIGVLLGLILSEIEVRTSMSLVEDTQKINRDCIQAVTELYESIVPSDNYYIHPGR